MLTLSPGPWNEPLIVDVFWITDPIREAGFLLESLKLHWRQRTTWSVRTASLWKETSCLTDGFRPGSWENPHLAHVLWSEAVPGHSTAHGMDLEATLSCGSRDRIAASSQNDYTPNWVFLMETFQFGTQCLTLKN